MEFHTGGGEAGGRWRLHRVVLVVLLWMNLHEHVLGCSSTNCNLVLTEAQGEITSPCYPQKYPNSQACKWTMQAPAGFIVQLSFLDFDLEEAPGCIYDRVLVNTGSTDVKFCGLTANGLTLNSTGNVMELSFTSDFSVQKRGFNVSFQHVAVVLRNQKVRTYGDNSRVTQVANTVSIPTLTQLTICFELQRQSDKQDWWLFTYYNSNNTRALSLGAVGNRMTMIINGKNCTTYSDLSPAYFTSQMKPVCVAWKSETGRMEVYLNGTYRPSSFYPSAGESVLGGGTFRLGGEPGFDGYIYNLRLWDRSMSEDELKKLKCDAEGNVIDWDHSNWTIPETVAQTDTTLSCSTALTLRTPTRVGCLDWLLYRALFEVTDGSSALNQSDVEDDVYNWLRQSFSNWTHIYVYLNSRKCSLQTGASPASYKCQVLLENKTLDKPLDEAAVSNLLSSTVGLIKHGLQIQPNSINVKLIDSCPKERSQGYDWPEAISFVPEFQPCIFNKNQRASRTCDFDPDTFTRSWSAVNDSECSVTPENAEEVAEGLVTFTNRSNLTADDVSVAVKQVEELVNLPKLNSTFAATIVDIISNVMNNSEAADASKIYAQALQTVETLAQRIEFDGPNVTIASKNLILGVRALNSTTDSSMSFSAFKPPNADHLEIDFDSDNENVLAQVTLPASLLKNKTLSLSRINFMFFNNTKFFLQKQGNHFLKSYVVASSVGNMPIKDLKDPVTIMIAHLPEQRSANPVCMFWDFTMNNQLGGWNQTGCNVSESNSSTTICKCDHLTHFGILMDLSRTPMDSKNMEILTYLSNIGCGISAIFMSVTLLTYITFEKLRRDYPSKILMNLSASLLFLNIVFLLDSWLASLEPEWLCQGVAVFLHYFLLTSFTWMGLESVHMYIALVKVFNTYVHRYILKFCLVGWGIPAVVVLTVVSVDPKNYGWQNFTQAQQNVSNFCFINTPAVFYTTCVGYFCVVFLLNVAMFIVVMMQICGRNGKRSNRTLREEVLRNLRSAISLTFLLGMTWGFGLFAWGPVHDAFMYLFTIFNSLQGLFIFIFHCALKENVQKQWRRYLCCSQFKPSDNSDWSKTATNNTKKVSSDHLGKSVSSSSFGSSTANWTSKAKVTLNPFSRRHVNADKSNQTSPKCVSSSCSSSEVEPNSSSSSSSILPVSQMIDKVKGYCSTRTDNFYKNIIMSDSYTLSTRF